MVAEAMTEAARGEDTRGGTVTSQVVSERVQVPKAHSLTGRSMTRAISGGHGSGFGRIEVPVVWTRSALTGSDKIAAVISRSCICLLYTSDAADEEDSVDLGGRRIIKKKKKQEL